MPLNPSSTERDLPRESSWRRPFNVLQTNLQDIDAGMDVEAAADAVRDYGADTWLINAGGISSFYPTDLPFQTRNPLLGARPSGDLFGDAVVAARSRGIRVIARFDMSKVAPRIAAAHPEWLYRSPTGEPQVYNTLSSACPSGAYYQKRTFDVLDEVFDRYDVDGVFFNWFNFNERDYDEVMHAPCHCEACRAGFAEFSGGRSLPADMRAPEFGLWRRYVTATLGGLTARIVDHVGARGRDIGVMIRRGAPIEYLEGNNAYRAMPGKELWPHATAEAVSAQVTARPDASVMVNCVAFIDATYRMGAEQPEHFAQYLVQTVARGGNPSAYYFGAPGRLPMDRAVSVGREVMRFRSEHGELYRHLRPAATVGLVRPDHASAAPGTYWDVIEEFRGVYSALLEAHLPFDVLPVADLARPGADTSLRRYDLVVLPDVGVLGDGARAVDAYVRGGGTLFVTGSSGVGAGGALELASSPALQALAPPIEGEGLRSTYVTDVPQPRIDEYCYEGPVIPVFGRYQRFAWKPGARRSGALLPRAPFGPPELSYGHVMGGDPDHVRSDFGAGQVVHIPWTIGRTYREFGKTEIRDHFADVARSVLRVPVTADVHESVELVVGSSGGRTVVHLINHSGARRRSYGPHVPVPGGRLRLTGRAGADCTATALVSGTPLRGETDGDDLVLALPTLDLYEVVTIAFE
ncbi:alpha-amylase family protein [Nocardiopsis tropica]|uniref:Beta-galactosidase trimerization domain-containing protein n=1 Tax=Nocardiopsis tropica TaxID=109330 RepID=A0ABU7KKM1_9ACTN|nr:alpha-amylase family protein [Nocardiopsis umidischolae]MEE2049838.1 beta-galactosidase trimerization domain-containing protein [Nocardiopsis umidischolae]